MTLLNVTYTLKCDSKLISLGQLRKLRISYHDYPDSMILKQKRSKIRLAVRYKNLFVFEIESGNKIMFVQKKSRFTYLLSSKPKIQLQHHRFGYASNIKVVQASKLVDGIDLGNKSGFIDKSYFSDSKPDSNSDVDVDIPASINKTTEHDSEDIKELYKACITSKHTKIFKSKKMILITQRLQKVHTELWGSHKPAFISSKNYLCLLFDKFTCKSQILLLRNKDKFFYTFKFQLLRVEAYGNRLNCLQTDGGGDLLALLFRIVAKNKEERLDTSHCTCIKKMAQRNDVGRHLHR